GGDVAEGGAESVTSGAAENAASDGAEGAASDGAGGAADRAATDVAERTGSGAHEPVTDEPSVGGKQEAECHSFAGSTGVLMADGGSKAIDQIKVGDHVENSVPG